MRLRLYRISLLASFVAAAFTMGCSSVTPETPLVADPFQVEPENQLPELVETEDPTAVLGDATEFDGDIDGYCLDDIYMTYLRERALQKAPMPSDKHMSAKTRMRWERTRELNAMHEALTVMNGKTASVFGGIPITSSAAVDTWIHYYKTRGKANFLKWLVRAEHYREMVLPILETEGLPSEIFYLAMIESGFSNNAKSRARAIGTWQFMQGTAKLYGLRVDRWVDERRDPTKSTLAAARYLRDLYMQFGDWHLAIAAYNAGPGKIRSSIRKSGSRDFWKLAASPYIKQETKDYIPKLLASLIVAADPEHFGFNIHNLPMEDFPSSFVTLSKSYQLEELAQRLGTTVGDLKRWNPEIMRGMTPPVSARLGGTYKLRLPAFIAARFPDAEPHLADTKISEMIEYVVKKGDTLDRISHRFGVSNRRILAVNPELNPRKLRPTHLLYVPLTDENEVATAR